MHNELFPMGPTYRWYHSMWFVAPMILVTLTTSGFWTSEWMFHHYLWPQEGLPVLRVLGLWAAVVAGLLAVTIGALSEDWEIFFLLAAICAGFASWWFATETKWLWIEAITILLGFVSFTVVIGIVLLVKLVWYLKFWIIGTVATVLALRTLTPIIGGRLSAYMQNRATSKAITNSENVVHLRD